MKREKLDPSWHKARVAARILLKARQGRVLNAWDKRRARRFVGDRGVEIRLIQQGLYSLSFELRTEAMRRAAAYREAARC